MSQFAVAAVLGRQIDDHRTGRHGRYHVGGNQLGCRFAGNKRGGNDDVDFFGLSHEQRHFGIDKGLTHFLGITVGRVGVFFILEFQELATHGVDLLLHLGAGIEGTHNGAQRTGGTDGGQTGHPGTNHQHLGGRHLAGSGDLAGKEAAEFVGGFYHGTIAGNVGHGRQSIQRLGA